MAAQVTIYKEPSITIKVFDEDPPADQTALVVKLTGERDDALAALAVTKARLDTLNADIDAAQGKSA